MSSTNYSVGTTGGPIKVTDSSSSFCDTPIWDVGLSWNTTDPDLTPCFQRVVLTAVPCLFLFIMIPFHVYILVTSKRKPIGHTWVNLSQTILTSLLGILTLADLFRAVHEHSEGWYLVPTVEFTAPLVLCTAFTVCIVLIQVGRTRGIRSSGIIFMFWLLLTLSHLFVLISRARNAVEQGYVEDLFRFILFIFHYIGVIVMVGLSSCVEAKSMQDKIEESDLNPCPELESPFISRITFWWCTSLIVKGFKSALERKDLWLLNDCDKSANVSPLLEENWQEEVLRSRRSRVIHKTSKQDSHGTPMLSKDGAEVKVTQPHRQYEPSLFKALIKTYLPYFSTSLIFKFMHDSILFVQPQLLKYMIQFTWDFSQPHWRGFVYAAGLFVAAQIQSLMLHQYFHRCNVTGMRLRSGIVAAVYKKSLKLTSASKKESTVGEIVNLMSVDAQRFMELTTYLNMVWSGPLQIGVALYFLWNILGPSVLVGLAVTILLIPLNGVIAHFAKKLQVKQMKNKDIRIKYMNEILNGMKVLKLYAWEQSFMDQVLGIRNKELRVLKKQAYMNACATFTWNIAPFLVSLSTFAVYVMSSPDHVLDAEKAFVSLSLFNILRFPLFMLPMLISNLVQAHVSLNRLSKFLKLDELKSENVNKKPSEKSEHVLNVEDGNFSWGPDEDPIIQNINMNVKPGSLVAVVGAVGAGKSSLLSAILGEMERISGKVEIQGSIAYVPQQAWIQNGTFEENVLFSKDKCTDLYERVIDSCALRPDLEIMHDGDQTEIGEKGINLSGGQKQRVSMARAVYNDADIYLLDDPLSAVDAHVGKHMFEKVIGSKGILAKKTRVLVTHGISFLPQMDWIMVICDGEIKEEGTYQDLLNHAGPCAEFIRNYLAEENMEDVTIEMDEDGMSVREELMSQINLLFDGSLDLQKLQGRSRSHHDLFDPKPTSEESRYIPLNFPSKPQGRSKMRRKSLSHNDLHLGTNDLKLFSGVQNSTMLSTVGSQTLEEADLNIEGETAKEMKEKEKLIKAEKAETGNVKFSVFFTYFKALGIPVSFLIVFLFALTQAAKVGADVWLSDWSNEVARNNGTMGPEERDRRLGVYGAFGVISDFDKTDDEVMSGQSWYGKSLEYFLKPEIHQPIIAWDCCVATVMSYLTLRVANLHAAKYLHRDLLENILRSPMVFFESNPSGRIINRFSHDVEVLDNTLQEKLGSWLKTTAIVLTTVLLISISTPLFLTMVMPLLVIYFCTQRFYVASSRQLKRLESVSRSPIYSHFGETVNGASVIRAFGHQERFINESHRRVDENQIAYYPNVISNRWLAVRLELVATLVVLFAAVFAVVGRDHLSPGIVGLSVTYALNVTQILNWMVRMSSELETNIVAVERIKEYTETETEAPWSIPDKSPQSEWPQHGEIEMKDFSIRYRETLDLVLKGINIHIHAGEKVGVVGRTGAGKSSLVMGLFRILEPVDGAIYIDGVNIVEIGLHDLRSKLTVIPQDPILFSGTLRMNLDPFNKHSDEEVWKALEFSHLKNFVNTLSSGLLHEISEGGENISVGQRQLVCLARALLRKTKILVLDEATAAIDLETDDLIQSTIRNQFAECTVVTIAHRINTVMDYTRILGLENGKVREFDSPQKLLEDKSSLFYSLAKSAGLAD